MNTNLTVVPMMSAGASPACQVHFPDGSVIFPSTVMVSNGATTSTFMVPIAFKHQAESAGLVAPSMTSDTFPQGPTASRPTAPADGSQFYDQTIGRLVIFRAADGTWRDSRSQASV